MGIDMRVILIICILLAIGLVIAVGTGYYIRGVQAVYWVHVSLGIAGIAVVAYLTYEAFFRAQLPLLKILASIVLILALIQVITGVIMAPEIHGVLGPAMLVLAAITGYAGYRSSKSSGAVKTQKL
ncbi:MAG: hypothetical protein QXQ57_04575 [Sulfolobales archaeon]